MRWRFLELQPYRVSARRAYQKGVYSRCLYRPYSVWTSRWQIVGVRRTSDKRPSHSNQVSSSSRSCSGRPSVVCRLDRLSGIFVIEKMAPDERVSRAARAEAACPDRYFPRETSFKRDIDLVSECPRHLLRDMRLRHCILRY